MHQYYFSIRLMPCSLQECIPTLQDVTTAVLKGLPTPTQELDHVSAQADCAPLQLLVIHISRQINHLPIADSVLPPARQNCVQIHLSLHQDVIVIAVSCCCCCRCSTRAPSSCEATCPA